MLIPVAACTRRARRRLSPREDETHIDVVCRWLSADKDRATATHTLVAHAFVNNSGADDADDDDDDDTSRFLHHGAERDSFLSSRPVHCAKRNWRLGKRCPLRARCRLHE
jgi:hypothetical protein